jgi:predicted nucleic acid-binding protein
VALVPDVSAVVALALTDEEGAYAISVIEAITESEAVVPTLFWFELRNVLIIGERRGRLTPDRTAAFLSALAVLPFTVDDQPRESVVLDFARRFDLTIYDAAYLELAQRRGLALATLDRALMRAAGPAGVTLFR